MNILAKTGEENIAMVYIAQMNNGRLIEFVESVQPPVPREIKWVLILSTLYGCPVGCSFCDAGNHYQGKLSKGDIFLQIDYLIRNRFPGGRVPVEKFKIQFARMGDPALNENVLAVLEELPERYDAPGLLPSLSTIAPDGTEIFFEKLLEIKRRLYPERFQLQFSIHTTDLDKRDWLIPVKKWDFESMANYGKKFIEGDKRKIALNFALANEMPVDVDILLRNFPPENFLIKITPVNPTYQASKRRISSYIRPGQEDYEIINALKEAGYEVILSIGELTENDIGSNCGQHVTNYLREKEIIEGGYTYPLTNSETTEILNG